MDNINEIRIIYEFNEYSQKIRIFGDKFVENNKNICKLLINGKIEKLKTYINREEINHKNIFEIKLRGLNNVTYMSHIFSDCSSLKELPDISKWKLTNVTNMSCMLSKCSSLKELTDISKWNTNNIKDMKGIFNQCTSLKGLPNIVKWTPKNNVKVDMIFEGCSSLIFIPDISKWDVNTYDISLSSDSNSISSDYFKI